MKVIKCFIFGIFIAVLVMAAAGCASSGGNTPSPSASVQPSSSPAPSASVGSVAVNIKGFAFTPSEITINKGETITWTNEDSAAHTVTGDAFDSGSMRKGDTFSFTFTEVGSFDYICSFHPSMKGKVIVQ